MRRRERLLQPARRRSRRLVDSVRDVLLDAPQGARGLAFVFRIEPLRVSPLPGNNPLRNTVRPAAPAVTAMAALPAAEDRGP